MPIIDYDTRYSPPTYGDFLMTVMYARYCGMVGNASFRILHGEYRQDWLELSKENIDALLIDYLNISMQLCGDAVLFSTETTRNNFRTYSHALRAVSPVIARKDQLFIDKFLLKPQDFEGCAESLPLEPYITWHVRHNEKWAPERNLTDDESMRVADYLQARFPDEAIMVVSDAVGCERYRAMFPDLLYSKDYSRSFMGDCEIVLSSDFYFAQRGGGMSVVPMFSRLPYEIRAEQGYLFLDGSKASSWARDDQQYITNPLTIPTIETLREEENVSV